MCRVHGLPEMVDTHNFAGFNTAWQVMLRRAQKFEDTGPYKKLVFFKYNHTCPNFLQFQQILAPPFGDTKRPLFWGR